MMVDKIDPNDYVVIADRSQESVQIPIVSPPTDSKKVCSHLCLYSDSHYIITL